MRNEYRVIKTPEERKRKAQEAVHAEADYLRGRIESGLANAIDDLPPEGGTTYLSDAFNRYDRQRQFCFDLLKKSGWRTVEWKVVQRGFLFWKTRQIKLIVEPLTRGSK